MAKSARARSTCAAGALSERLRRVSSWRSSAVSGRRGSFRWRDMGHLGARGSPHYYTSSHGRRPTSGGLLFTDGAVLPGAVSIDELDIRASKGGFLLVPPGLNETAMAAAGLILRRCDDRPQAIADIATRLYAARQSRSPELAEMEGGQW